MTQKKYKYDMLAFLKSIRYKNKKYYSSLSEEEQKAVSPVVLMQQLTATYSAKQIFYINELVNPFVFNISKHTELLCNLMILCTDVDQKYKKKIKPLSKKTSNTPKSVKIIMKYFDYSTLKAIDAVQILSNDVIIDFAEQLGTEKKDLAAIKKELKSRKK